MSASSSRSGNSGINSSITKLASRTSLIWSYPGEDHEKAAKVPNSLIGQATIEHVEYVKDLAKVNVAAAEAMICGLGDRIKL